MVLWSEILQHLVGNYQKEEKMKYINFDSFHRSPLKDTLVRESREIPPFPPEGYSGEKIPLFPPQGILW